MFRKRLESPRRARFQGLLLMRLLRRSCGRFTSVKSRRLVSDRCLYGLPAWSCSDRRTAGALIPEAIALPARYVRAGS